MCALHVCMVHGACVHGACVHGAWCMCAWFMVHVCMVHVCMVHVCIVQRDSVESKGGRDWRREDGGRRDERTGGESERRGPRMEGTGGGGLDRGEASICRNSGPIEFIRSNNTQHKD